MFLTYRHQLKEEGRSSVLHHHSTFWIILQLPPTCSLFTTAENYLRSSLDVLPMDSDLLVRASAREFWCLRFRSRGVEDS